jgi:hypothetical protein
LTFSSNGEEKIEETLADSYKSVRVRTSSNTLGTVSLEISGLTSVSSANLFAVLANLTAGASGDQGIIDTALLFPPSGLETDINFACAGSFEGTILVEGSLNGSTFNPIGVFQAGTQQKSIFNLPARLEFEQLSTPNKTRYVRLSVQGQVFGPTTITVGGVVTGLSPSSTTLAQAYANGLTSADQTMVLLDTKGGGIVVDGTGAFTGNYGLTVNANEHISLSLSIGVDTGIAPSARLHLPAGTATASTAPLKIDAGTVLAATEVGAIESNGTHLYWTDSGGTRWQLDNGASGVFTLAQAYSVGTMSSDQTFTLLDSDGGGLIVNGTNVGFTGAYLLAMVSPNAGVTVFPTVGGFYSKSNVSVAAAAGTIWDDILFDSSSITLTGGPAVVTALAMVRTGSATVNGPGNTVTDAYNLRVGTPPSGTAAITRAWSLGVPGRTQFGDDLAVGLAGSPSAWIHVTGATAAAGSAPVKIDPGTLMVAPENGAIESDGTHVYWTNSGGTRLQLDNGAAGVTLAVTYTSGSVSADQTFSLLDVDGGGLIVDATAGGFTGGSALAINAPSAGQVLFPRVGGLSVQSSVAVAAAPGAVWNEVDFAASSLTLTGGPAVATSVAMSHIGSGTINGPGNTATDAYNLLIDAAPSGTATLTRPWSLGAAGAVLFGAGLVLGTGLTAPGENDLVFGVGATAVSATNSGRLGYIADGKQQFYVSMNTGAYVPVLVGPAAPGFTTGSVAFGLASGQLGQDNANFFWDDTSNRLGLVVAASPTATLHLPAGSAAAGSAPLKITHSGTLLTVKEPGAIESDAAHIYWTNAGGTRIQLDNVVATTTLAAAYADGAVSADQTLLLLDAKGGAFLVDGTDPGFTGTYLVQFKGLASSAARFPNDGGLALFQGNIDSAQPTTLSVTGGAHTNIIAGAEEVGALFNFSATKTWATGAIAAQREVVFTAPTYGFNAASVITTAATVAITGSPTTGVNATITNAYALWVQAGITNLAGKTAIGVTLPTATLHVAASTAAAGTASLKIPSGAVLAVIEPGAVEADANHLYWTNAAGARLQLDNAASATTLAQAYANGTVADDQTFALLDTKGGGVIVDGTAGGFTGTSSLVVNATAAGTVLFPRVGGLSVQSSVSVAAAPGSVWSEVNFAASTITLTGGPATSTALAMVRVGQGTVNGAGNTVTDAYDVFVDVAPVGSATLTRSWSLGVAGAAQMGAGLVLGTALSPPGENDLVFGVGATNVSAANTGRLGYIAGASQQFYVSMNTGAYVPLLVGPAAGGFTQGSVPFATASGQLGQDNTKFFWDDTNIRLGVGNGAPSATLHVVQPAVATGLPTAFLLASGAHTNLTLSTEDVGVNFNLSATKQWATGAIATQREALFQAPTYAFVGASVITNSATVAITGAPAQGANATITNAYALWVQAGITNLAGKTAIGVTLPTATLHLAATTATAGTASLKIPSGVVLAVTEPGAIEADANHLYWTNAAGVRLQLDDTAAATLATTYANGAVAADQTLVLLDTKGGGLVVDGTAVGFTGAFSFKVTSTNVAAASDQNAVWVTSTFAPTGGNATFEPVKVSYTVNQTGGANGAVTGILLNATETAVVGAHNLVDLQVATVSRFKVDRFGDVVVAQAAQTALVPTALTITSGAHTNITAGTEDIGANFNFSATKQWATGALATQREVLFQAPTYAFVGASVVTSAATVAITGAPAQGANATISNAYALWIQSGSSQFVATQSVVSATGANWNGINFAASTLTLTGAVTPVTELVFTNVAATTITSGSAITVGIAASLAIAGPPAQAGSTTITNPLALHVQSGVSRFSGNVGINTTIAPQAQLEIVTGTFVAANVAGNATNGGALKLTSLGLNGPEAIGGLEFENGDNILGSGQGGGAKLFVEDNNRTFGIAVRFQSAAWTKCFTIGEQYSNFTIGGANKPTNGCNVQLNGAPSFNLNIVAATGLTWNGITLLTGTFAFSGATTPITELDAVRITAPTINSVSAVVTTDVFTCHILAPLFSGSASATRSWSLGVDGNTKLGGGQNINGTDVNVAGPYTVLATDYVLEVRRTATAPISINLPLIATVGNGHIVISKDSGYNAAVNNITLVRSGGDTIENVASNYIQNVTGSAIWFKANTTTNNWEII